MKGWQLNKMEVLLEVGSFDVDGGVEMAMTQVHTNIQKCDFRGRGMPSEFDRIAAVEVFKELSVGVITMRPKKENVIDNAQPEAGFLESRVKEILFKETH
jgi:hypothetical protein